MDLIELMGRHALGRDRPEDYIAWAEEQMLDGVETENLPILASMDLEKPIDSVEVRECFGKVVGELGLHWPEPQDCIKEYADALCRRIIDGEIDPREAVGNLAAMYYADESANPLLLYWLYLDEDISLLDTEHGAIFNYGLNGKNVDEYVGQVAVQQLKLSKLALPREFDRYCHCTQCGYVGASKLEKTAMSWMPDSVYRIFFRREPARMHVCDRCGSKSIMLMTSYEGREAYLASLE